MFVMFSLKYRKIMFCFPNFMKPIIWIVKPDKENTKNKILD